MNLKSKLKDIQKVEKLKMEMLSSLVMKKVLKITKNKNNSTMLSLKVANLLEGDPITSKIEVE